MTNSWIISLFRAANRDWTSRLFTLILIVALTYSATKIFAAKTNVKTCDSCEKQRNELIQALIDIRTELEPKTVSYSSRPDAFIFAMYDTTKPQQQEQKVQKVLSKIDSLLMKYKVPQQKQKSSI